MTRRQGNNTPATTALVIPDDIRADLLRAQVDQIDTQQRLPRVKIMAAGAGLFEFSDTLDTVREFRGVILNSHARNVLWDRPYGDDSGDEEDRAPACVSEDGRYGAPRTGFIHLGIGRERPALGNERIECESCPYNQWRSAELVGRSGKGKACTNQRSVYVMVEDRDQPVELLLPPTSIPNYDAYLANLAGRGIPVQAVVTIFKQERKDRGGLRWSVATFTEGDALDAATFEKVIERRTRYRAAITPPDPLAAPAAAVEAANDSQAPGEEDDDIPF